MISLRVRLSWSGTSFLKFESHIAGKFQQFSNFTVLQLRIMRARVCDKLKLSLPYIPHPKSEDYDDGSMLDAMEQLVTACFDRNTLNPECHAIGLSLVGIQTWLWRMYVFCEQAMQNSENPNALNDVPAADAPSLSDMPLGAAGNDSETSDDW